LLAAGSSSIVVGSTNLDLNLSSDKDFAKAIAAPNPNLGPKEISYSNIFLK
jgi:hypothetical protein